MRRCPICEKEQVQGSVCDSCGFDFSCDYERNRTLCSVLPKSAEPISARAEKWKRQQSRQAATTARGALVCPKCGGKSFSVLMSELQFMCTDCGAKMPISFPGDRSADSSAENKTADGLDAPPVSDPAPAETAAVRSGTDRVPERETEEKPSDSIVFHFGRYDSEPEPKKERVSHPSAKKAKLLVGIAAGLLILFFLLIVNFEKIFHLGFRIQDGVLIEYTGSGGAVTIPNSVSSIGDYAFAWCNNLTSVTIGSSVTRIGEDAFRDCKNLTSVTIGNSVTSIGNYAFVSCSNLTSVTIPNSVTSIGAGAFSDCNNLTGVTIPDSVTSIEFAAFFNCGNLTDVYYGGSEAQWDRIHISELNNPLLKANIHFMG